MSFLQYPEAMNVPKLQVWDNAAFDSEEPTKASFSSWSSLHPVIETQSESHESDQSKENLSPVIMNSSVSVKSSIPTIIKPLHSNGVLGNSQRKPTKVSAGKNGGSVENPPATATTKLSMKKKNGSEQEDTKKIDAEIEEIENEIKRLSSRLEALRLEKITTATATASEKRGRVVPAKFMEAKQSVKIEEPSSSVKAKPNRRAVSMGPSEIFAGARFRPPGKLEITPVQPIQSRRKSCFWKLQEIDETKSIIERRKSMTASKIEGQKQKIAATTTLRNRKNMKKESPTSSKSSSLSSSGVLSLIQPRKLFKDGNEKEKSVPTTNKKPLKPGRVVASRYNQNMSSLEAARKRSLPEKEKEKEDGGKKSRGNQVTEGRIKKRWEIPSEEEKEKKPLMMMMMTDLLPRIKTTRCVDESPRGSGPAKKVSELEKRKKKSFFCTEEEEDENEDDEEHLGVPMIKTIRFVDESPRGSGPAKKVSELERRKKKSFFCTEEEDENEDDEEHHGVALEFAQEEEGDYDDDDDDDERLMK